jgi:large subunit ribosomal protein L24
VLDDRVIVDGINLVKKHAKGNPQMGDPGGIQEKEMPVHISNIALFNPATKKGERVGFRINEDGKKERFFRSDSSSVDG